MTALPTPLQSCLATASLSSQRHGLPSEACNCPPTALGLCSLPEGSSLKLVHTCHQFFQFVQRGSPSSSNMLTKPLRGFPQASLVLLGDTFCELFLPVGDILSCFSVCLVRCKKLHPLKSAPFLGLRALLPGGFSEATCCLVTSLSTVLCCVCRCCRVVHYDSPPRLLEPPMEG